MDLPIPRRGPRRCNRCGSGVIGRQVRTTWAESSRGGRRIGVSVPHSSRRRSGQGRVCEARVSESSIRNANGSWDANRTSMRWDTQLHRRWKPCSCTPRLSSAPVARIPRSRATAAGPRGIPGSCQRRRAPTCFRCGRWTWRSRVIQSGDARSWADRVVLQDVAGFPLLPPLPNAARLSCLPPGCSLFSFDRRWSIFLRPLSCFCFATEDSYLRRTEP
jgi:hypothetical protein